MLDKTNPDWSAWAREQLHLGESSTSGDARQRYMQRLADEDFVPPPHLPYALAVVEGNAGPPGANEEAVWSEIGDRQRQRVEEFARCFFQIPSDERRQQWLQLRGACEGTPTLAKRLDRLGPGLALDPDGLAVADPIVRELVQEVCKIFVLRPFDAAQARAAFVRQKTVDAQGGLLQWETAARNLMMSHPDYEVLAPELIQQIIHWQSRSQELSRRRMSGSATDPGSRMVNPQLAPLVTMPTGQTFWDNQTLMPMNAQLAPVVTNPSEQKVRSTFPATFHLSDKKTSNKLPFWLIGPLFVAATLALRVIPVSNSYSPPPDRFKPDEFKEINWQDERVKKELDEVFQKMLQENEAKQKDKGFVPVGKDKIVPNPPTKSKPVGPSENPPP
jgi:hypothetical protein